MSKGFICNPEVQDTMAAWLCVECGVGPCVYIGAEPDRHCKMSPWVSWKEARLVVKKRMV
jgi:rubredoxin